MNAEQIAKLKELAQAATPGPWRHDGIEYGDMGHRYQTVTEQNDGDYVVGEYGIQEHDAAFISAANPAATLELIAVAERALLAAAPAPIQQAITYPPDGTVSPFTVINLGHGQVKMGDCVHDERLPALWFGKDGLGMGVEQVMNRAAAEGETLAVVTFSNVEGLDVLAEVVQRIRRISFPDAATPPALAGSQVQAAGDTSLEDRVRDAVAAALGEAMDCTRVWSAWSYGTMGPDDFSVVANDDDRLDEIVQAALTAMREQP